MAQGMRCRRNTGLHSSMFAAFIMLVSPRDWSHSEERPPTQTATRQTSPVEARLNAQQIGRRVWMMLDALEQHHITKPDRLDVLKAIVPTLCSPSERSSPSTVFNLFKRCQNEAEFVTLFEERLDSLCLSTSNLEELPAVIAEDLTMQGQFGTIRFFRAKEYAVEEQFRNNRYVGLGVALKGGSNESPPQFMKIIPGGSAERGGLEENVSIIEIDRKPTRNIPTTTLLDWLRGPLGSEVTLKILSPGQAQEREVTLTRGLVRFDSVFARDRTPVSKGPLRLNPSEPIGYLLLTDITGSTLQELRDAEIRVRADQLRVMILDFTMSERAGNLHQAKLVADGLLDGGTLWQSQGRDTDPHTETADRECLFRGMPLVVVVNERTGDAHAAVAAALQDAGRAIIVGQSPGYQGGVASGIPLTDEAFVVWMNTSRIIRSRSDRKWPLVPDHVTLSPQAMMAQTTTRLATSTPLQIFNRGAPPATDGAISALAPSNLTSNEVIVRLIERRTIVAPFKMPIVQNLNSVQESPLDAAKRIARDLLKRVPPSI